MEDKKPNKEERSERNTLFWVIIIICLGIASSLSLGFNKIEKVIKKVDIMQKSFSRLGESLDEAVLRLEENYRMVGAAIGDRTEEHLDRIESKLNDSPDRIGERIGKRIDDSLDRIEGYISLLAKERKDAK